MMSLFVAEGRGQWTGIDLFSKEIRVWQRVDPLVDPRVEDAHSLFFPDGGFDGCLCISVIEDVPGDGDSDVMAEMLRVLGPGGVVHLTTNVSARGDDVMIDDRHYDEASVEVEPGTGFSERRYAATALDERLLRQPWNVLTREYVRMRDPSVHERVARMALRATRSALRCAESARPTLLSPRARRTWLTGRRAWCT